MAKRCERCGYHADESGPACEKCGGAMKLTFLPPPGTDAAPVDGVPTEFRRRYGNNAELADGRVAAPVSMLTNLVPWNAIGPVAFIGLLSAVLAVLWAVTK